MIKQLTSALCGLMLLTGCAAVGPDYRLPPTEIGGKFANASQGKLSSDSIDTTWWRGFKDKELDRLVDLALRANHDRRIASARLREARALWSETSLDRYLTVTAGASYSNEQLSTAAIPGTRLIDRDRELYSASFDAFWGLDFFGRVRRSVEARTAEVLSSLPKLLTLGRPQDLLRRRPDIRAAERNLAAATARIGIATADLFPPSSLCSMPSGPGSKHRITRPWAADGKSRLEGRRLQNMPT
jgi:multidrug efflux system outer membrane protein